MTARICPWRLGTEIRMLQGFRSRWTGREGAGCHLAGLTQGRALHAAHPARSPMLREWRCASPDMVWRSRDTGSRLRRSKLGLSTYCKVEKEMDSGLMECIKKARLAQRELAEVEADKPMQRPFVPKACRFRVCQLASIPSAANCPHWRSQPPTAPGTLLLYEEAKRCFSPSSQHRNNSGLCQGSELPRLPREGKQENRGRALAGIGTALLPAAWPLQSTLMPATA